MSMNHRGEITTYFAECLNYSPDKTKPIDGLRDQLIGQIYKCTNLKDSSKCYKCSNYKDKNKITDIEKFKYCFLSILENVIDCNRQQILTSPLFTNSFDTLTIDKGLEELIKENKINVEYSFSGPVYSSKENKLPLFSNRLRLLLIASKKKEGEFNKEFVASTLAEEFHPEMSLMDALHHCVAAYQEALNHKEFELAYRGDPQTLLMELLKAPSKQVLFPKSSDTYSLEQYYNSYINYILQQLRLTNIDWCRKELGFD